MADKTETKTRKLVASDLLKTDHPLHKAFVAWCGEHEPSKRQARKFLQAPKHAAYREIEVEVE